VDTAVAHQVDLIVMSTHGYSGVTRWLMGSVTEKVLRCTPCPILIVRSPAPINKILITLDGSELAERALDPGLAVAHKLDAKICLLRVAADMLINPMEFAALEQAGSGLGQQIQESSLANAQNYLADVMARNPELGERGKTAVLQGSAAKTILDYAEAEEIDLIVMATHGRTGLRRWVYGSVTERVLHGAHSAVLIIRPPDDVLQ
jgi:nucleotide-binding universal stress UspA family protein